MTSLGLEHGYTDHLHDSETGLIYANARYLDPKTSRWLSSDPALDEYIPMAGADPADLRAGGVFSKNNLAVYHYANNNPLRYVDPTGEYWGAWEQRAEPGPESFLDFLKGLSNAGAWAVAIYGVLSAPATGGMSLVAAIGALGWLAFDDWMANKEEALANRVFNKLVKEIERLTDRASRGSEDITKVVDTLSEVLDRWETRLDEQEKAGVDVTEERKDLAVAREGLAKLDIIAEHGSLTNDAGWEISVYP